MPNGKEFKRKKRQYPDLSERDASNVVAAEDKFVEWFSDPEVRRRFPGTEDELDAGIQKALNTQIQTGDPGYGAEASYESGYPEKGYPDQIKLGTSDPNVVGHELSHAAQWDDTLGIQLRNVLGGGFEGDTRMERYLNKPGELYSNFHELRLKMGLKPWERSFTPQKVIELIQFQGLEGDEDVQRYLKQFGPEKISEALNKIASVEADGRRLERLNFTPDDNVIMRPTNTYA